MKKLLLTLLFPILSILGGCENWHETAGDLAGMWQLTEWKDTDGKVIATKDDGIYYSFQLELMKLQKLGDYFYLLYYTHEGDYIILGNIYQRPNDNPVESSSIEYLGAPTEGKFHIDCLSGGKMILSSSKGTLQFRKY